MSESLDLSTVLWTDAALGDWQFGATAERLIAMPNSGEIRQLLPWRPSSVMATWRRRSDDRPARRQWRDALGVAGLLTAGAMTRSRRLGVLPQQSLVHHVASLLGHSNVSGIVLCGPPRANQKPVIQLHDRWGRTIAYIKVAWNDLTAGLLDDEHAALDHLSALPDKGFTSPPVLASGVFGDSTWLALGPVGVDRRHRPEYRQFDTLAINIERTGSNWEGPTADSDYVAALGRRAADLDNGQRVVELLHDRWSDQTIRLGASHGDFVPWNTLSGSPEPAVWDWERYQTSAPLGFDRLHVRVQIGVHRTRNTLPETLRQVGRQLDQVLPDLTPAQRQAHFEWYIADLLCRYEQDSGADPERLPEFVTNLTDALKERHTPT